MRCQSNREKRRVEMRLVLKIAGIAFAFMGFLIVGITPRAFGDTSLPGGFSAQNGAQVNFDSTSNSQRGGNVYVQLNTWYYFGTYLTQCNLSNLGYNGNCNNEVVLEQGEINAQGDWCEDTGGLGDGNGPSMVVEGALLIQGSTDILSNSPSGYWSDMPQGTIGVSVDMNGVTLGGSYDVYQVTGQLNQCNGCQYTDYTFKQALNGGGCPSYAQAAWYWNFAQGLMSGADRCCWPQQTWQYAAYNEGHFWENNFWAGYPHQSAFTDQYPLFQGTG